MPVLPEENMATKVTQTCYVSTPFGVNTDSLSRALAERGIEATRLDNLTPGSEIPSVARAAVKEADFVCAVLPVGMPYGNVLFELGIAAGLGKPLFLIVDPGV